jgi:hypothetical protein
MDTPITPAAAQEPVSQALTASIAAAAQILDALPPASQPAEQHNPTQPIQQPDAPAQQTAQPTQHQREQRLILHTRSPEVIDMTSAQRRQYGIEGITDSIDTVRSLSLAPRHVGRQTHQVSLGIGGELPQGGSHRGGELRIEPEVVMETQQSYDTDEMLQPTQPELYTRAPIGRTPIPFGLNTNPAAIDLTPESPDSIPLTASRDSHGNVRPPPGFHNQGNTATLAVTQQAHVYSTAQLIIPTATNRSQPQPTPVNTQYDPASAGPSNRMPPPEYDPEHPTPEHPSRTQTAHEPEAQAPLTGLHLLPNRILNAGRTPRRHTFLNPHRPQLRLGMQAPIRPFQARTIQTPGEPAEADNEERTPNPSPTYSPSPMGEHLGNSQEDIPANTIPAQPPITTMPIDSHHANVTSLTAFDDNTLARTGITPETRQACKTIRTVLTEHPSVNIIRGNLTPPVSQIHGWIGHLEILAQAFQQSIAQTTGDEDKIAMIHFSTRLRAHIINLKDWATDKYRGQFQPSPGQAFLSLGTNPSLTDLAQFLLYDQHSPVPDTNAIRRRIESITHSRSPVSITGMSGGTSQVSTSSDLFKLYRYALAPNVPLWMHCIHPYSFTQVSVAVKNQARTIFRYCKSKIGLARDYAQKLDAIMQDLQEHGDHPETAPGIFTYEKFQWFADYPVGPYEPSDQNKVTRVEAIFDNQESISLTCLALARMAEDRYNIEATRRSATWYLDSLSKALCLQQQHYHFHKGQYNVKNLSVPPEYQHHLIPRIQMGPPPPPPNQGNENIQNPPYITTTMPAPPVISTVPRTPHLPMIPHIPITTNPPQAIIVLPPTATQPTPITLPIPTYNQTGRRPESEGENNNIPPPPRRRQALGYVHQTPGVTRLPITSRYQVQTPGINGFVSGGTQLGLPDRLTCIPPQRMLMTAPTTTPPMPAITTTQPPTNAYAFNYETTNPQIIHTQQQEQQAQETYMQQPPVNTIPPGPRTRSASQYQQTQGQAQQPDNRHWGNTRPVQQQTVNLPTNIGTLPDGRPRYTKESRGNYQSHPEIPAEWHSFATYFDYQKPNTPILEQDKLFREAFDIRSWPKHAILKEEQKFRMTDDFERWYTDTFVPALNGNPLYSQRPDIKAAILLTALTMDVRTYIYDMVGPLPEDEVLNKADQVQIITTLKGGLEWIVFLLHKIGNNLVESNLSRMRLIFHNCHVDAAGHYARANFRKFKQAADYLIERNKQDLGDGESYFSACNALVRVFKYCQVEDMAYRVGRRTVPRNQWDKHGNITETVRDYDVLKNTTQDLTEKGVVNWKKRWIALAAQTEEYTGEMAAVQKIPPEHLFPTYCVEIQGEDLQRNKYLAPNEARLRNRSTIYDRPSFRPTRSSERGRSQERGRSPYRRRYEDDRSRSRSFSRSRSVSKGRTQPRYPPSTEELERRIEAKVCYGCGNPGHMLRECMIRKKHFPDWNPRAQFRSRKERREEQTARFNAVNTNNPTNTPSPAKPSPQGSRYAHNNTTPDRSRRSDNERRRERSEDRYQERERSRDRRDRSRDHSRQRNDREQPDRERNRRDSDRGQRRERSQDRDYRHSHGRSRERPCDDRNLNAGIPPPPPTGNA